MQRILMKMSQEKLGEALGLTFQQVQKYEKGTNRIGASRLQQISKTLNVPPSFFFEGAPSSQPAGDGFAEESLAICRRFPVDRGGPPSQSRLRPHQGPEGPQARHRPDLDARGSGRGRQGDGRREGDRGRQPAVAADPAAK